MVVTRGFHKRESNQGMQRRLWVGSVLIAFAFAGLLWRLYLLQVLRGDELTDKGRRNFVQRIEIPHDRGIIYDRYGRILVDNRPSLDITVTPHFLGKADNAEKTLSKLEEILALDLNTSTAMRDKIASKRGLDRFVPITVKRDLEPEQVEILESLHSIFLLDGVNFVEGRRRVFHYDKVAAHLFGYVNEIDPTTLNRAKKNGNPLQYQQGDRIGRAGVERHLERDLRGKDGMEQVVVDAKGRRMHGDYVESLLGPDKRQAPTPGHNVYLTIDIDLQLAAEKAFDGRAGAAVALDPATGEILALVSRPGYDPNLISGLLAREEKVRLDQNPLDPWINRPIQGLYAPGSTFKVITALAALEGGFATVDEKINCPGYFRLRSHTWRCHRDAGHGKVNLKTAIKVSCDTYFYTVAHRMGINTIAEMGKKLGLGERSGISLRFEKRGIMPDEAFHDRVEKSTGGYQKGMAINTSIGQGSVLMTPLQLGMLYAAMANGGSVLRPQVIHHVDTADFRIRRRTIAKDGQLIDVVRGQPAISIREFETSVRRDVQFTPEHIHGVQAGLIAVAAEPGGTAYYRRSKLISMAAKTGTAQVVRLQKGKRLKSHEMEYEERDHAWFAGYAPVENPRIAVAVVNEHSGHGGSKAGPIAVRIIDAFVELENKRQLALGEKQP